MSRSIFKTLRLIPRLCRNAWGLVSIRSVIEAPALSMDAAGVRGARIWKRFIFYLTCLVHGSCRNSTGRISTRSTYMIIHLESRPAGRDFAFLLHIRYRLRKDYRKKVTNVESLYAWFVNFFLAQSRASKLSNSTWYTDHVNYGVLKKCRFHRCLSR